MALQAPQYNGPRMGQMPFVPADGDAFGAAEYRQAGQLAKQGLNASLDVLAAAQEQQKKCDTAVVKNATNQARIEMLDGMEKIKAERGANAQNARAETNALFDQVNRKYSGAVSGGNIERQEAFTNTMNSMRNQYELMGARHQARQMQQYEQDALDLENKAVLREVDALWRGNIPASIDDQKVIVDENQQILPPVNLGEETALRILRVRENIALRFTGYPAGYIEQMQDDAELQIHAASMNALVEVNPKGALEYLQQPEVQAITPPKLWSKQHEIITAAVKTADITADAVDSVSKMSPTDIMRKAYEDARYKNDPDARKQFIAITDQIAKRNDAIEKAEKADRTERLEEEFAASEYQTIPAEAMKDRDLYEKMLDFQSKLGKFEKENPIPDEEFLIELYNKTPEQIGEFLSTGENYSKFKFALAGDADWKAAILGKRNGVESGNAEGRNGRYGGMNLSEQIEANFPALSYTTMAPGTLWGQNEVVNGGVEYDSSDPAHKRIKANFSQEFRKRWNDTEQYKDVQPEERAENILYDIIGEYRTGKLKLDAPIYDTAMAARLQDGIDNPRVEYVNPDTGKTEVTIGNSKEGTVHTFEKVETETIQAILPGMTIGESFRVPETAEAGEYKGVKYDPGDIIVSSKDRRTWAQDSILVYDSNMNLNPESVDIGLSSAVGAPVASPAQQHAAPPKTLKMMAWEKTNGATFEWQEVTGKYIAETKGKKGILTGVNTYYEAMPNDEISYLGTYADTDKNILAQKEAGREEPGADILERIAELEEQISISERDPRSRKDREEDNRDELRRLRREYKNVTGQTAKESGYYVGE